MFLVGVTLLFCTPLFILAAQPFVRYLTRSFRSRWLAEMDWYELSVSQRVPTDNAYSVFSKVIESCETAWWPFMHLDQGHVSFVWQFKNGKLSLYVGVAGSSVDPETLVGSLSSSLGSTARKLDGCPDIPSEHLVFARRQQPISSRAEESGSEAGHVAKDIIGSFGDLTHDESVCLVCTIEPMSDSETQRLLSYFSGYKLVSGGVGASFGQSSERATHHAGRAAFVASSSHSDSSSINIMRSVLQGSSTFSWDAEVLKPHRLIRRSYQLPIAVFGAAMALLSVFIGNWLFALVCLAISLGMIATLRFVVAPAAAHRMAMWASKGEAVCTRYNRLSLRWWAQAAWYRQKSPPDSETKRAHVAPPSSADVFSLQPQALHGMFSLSRDVGERDKWIHANLTNEDVDVQWPIFLGRTGTNQPVCIDASDVQYGAFVAGTTGTGKTSLLQMCYLGCAYANTQRMSGNRITNLWLETKGQGAPTTFRSVKKVDKNAVLIETRGVRSKTRIAMEGKRLSEGASPEEVVANAKRLTDSLRFAFGSAIQHSSYSLLLGSAKIAMLLSEDELEVLGLRDMFPDPSRPNIIKMIQLILGGDTDINLGGVLMSMKSDIDQAEDRTQREVLLSEAIGEMSRTFSDKTRRAMENSISAPLNKLTSLLLVDRAWTPRPDVRDIPIESIIGSFRPIVINFGSPSTDDEQASSDANSIQMLRIFLYTFWTVVTQKCARWEDQNKRLAIFSDELRDIALDGDSDSSENIVAKMISQGRAYGACLFGATQSVHQIPEDTRRRVMDIRSKFWFSLSDAADQRIAVADLVSDGQSESVFKESQIKHLSQSVCAGIVKRRGSLSDPFSMQVGNAAKWAEVLADDSMDIHDKIADYFEWEDRARMERGLESYEPIRYQ